MLEFLFGKKDNSEAKDIRINEIYTALKTASLAENLAA